MKLRTPPAARVAATGLCTAALIVASAAVSRSMTDEPTVSPPADVVAMAPADVQRITVASDTGRAELTRATDGSWTAAPGTSRVAAALMPEVEERLFPLQAYRSLAGDSASPEFGLVEPEITFTVADRRGRRHRVLLGAATYTNGGVYARKATEAGRLYLVPRRMMDDLRSLVAGQRIDAPNDLPEQLQEKTPRHDGTSWWLRQAVDAGGETGGEGQ
jgi:hypothetical protein